MISQVALIALPCFASRQRAYADDLRRQGKLDEVAANCEVSLAISPNNIFDRPRRLL